jgi:hypothetical protein
MMNDSHNVRKDEEKEISVDKEGNSIYLYDIYPI